MTSDPTNPTTAASPTIDDDFDFAPVTVIEATTGPLFTIPAPPADFVRSADRGPVTVKKAAGHAGFTIPRPS
jgi:hypothetical protein